MADPAHPDRERPSTWDGAVARLDRLDRRPAIAIARSLYRAVDALAPLLYRGGGNPVERRRRAALAVRDALAAYRLTGGDPDHLLRVVGLPVVAGDVVAPLGDRARLARARIELALRTVDDDGADVHAAHVADVEQRAAALEQPGTHQLTPDDFDDADEQSPTDAARRYHADEHDVTTPGELAAVHDDFTRWRHRIPDTRA